MNRPRRMNWRSISFWPAICAVLGIHLVATNAIVGAGRTFNREPDILLGLRSDRSASLSFADLDGDGDLDVIVSNGRHGPQANEVFINNGAPADPEHIAPGGGYGQFTLGYALGNELSTSYAAAIGDLDGDGDPDVVVGNDRAPNLIYINSGGGRFTLVGPLEGEADLTRDVLLADLDRDGHLDLVVANRRAQNVIYPGDGKSGFGSPRPFGTSDDSTIKLAVGDVDEDGDPDLVLGNRDGQPNIIYFNDGVGRFEEAWPFGTGRDETLATAVVDLDDDGHLDIIAANAGEANAIYFGDGRGGFNDATRFGHSDGRSFSVGVADLDRDGDQDIVIGNVGRQNAIFFNAGTGRSFAEHRFGGTEDSTYWVALGDVNGDGYSDIGVANSDGLNGVHLNRSGEGAVHRRIPVILQPGARYVIYLHGRIIEESGLRPVHPRFGIYEYEMILELLAAEGLQVISEVRSAGTDAGEYAVRVVEQIEALRTGGVPMERITVIGFSKGAGIALTASSLLNRQDARFVLMGICGDWLDDYPDLQLRGHVLSVYEASDALGSSCRSLFERSAEGLETAEIRIDTGMEHGAFYTPRQAWLAPTLDWILGRSDPASGEGVAR